MNHRTKSVESSSLRQEAAFRRYVLEAIGDPYKNVWHIWDDNDDGNQLCDSEQRRANVYAAVEFRRSCDW